MRPRPALLGPFCVQYILAGSTSTEIPTHHCAWPRFSLFRWTRTWWSCRRSRIGGRPFLRGRRGRLSFASRRRLAAWGCGPCLLVPQTSNSSGLNLYYTAREGQPGQPGQTRCHSRRCDRCVGSYDSPEDTIKFDVLLLHPISTFIRVRICNSNLTPTLLQLSTTPPSCITRLL